ncbi:MAG: tetratricopeptide repeat protein [Desulfovibrio sp.]|jgi:tetratricopeptide (TPR) repeat protein|nr:tetratricopeptide repeat protein [Desulfovibrio sp.]
MQQQGKSAVAAMAQAQKTARFEKTIVDFVNKRGGRFVLITDDKAFQTLLRGTLAKYLGLDCSTVLTTLPDASRIVKVVKDLEADGCIPFAIMERMMQGQDMGYMVRQMKEAFPNLLVTILTAEADQHRIMYLHEIGVDNFIVKPVSTQTLLEKLASTIRPQDPLGRLVEEARVMLQEGDVEQAKELALHIVETRPGSPAGLMVLGDAELGLGNVEAAREAFQRASQNADLYLDPLRRLASLAENEGDYEQCLDYLERLDSLSPLNFERKVNMGEINLNLGNEEKADRLFSSAMTQVTKEAMGQIGNMAERIGAVYSDKDPVKAEGFLRKALSAKKDFLTREDLRIFNQLGISLRRQGRWEDAIEEYKHALEVADDEVTIHYNMGMAYAEGGLFQEAKVCMDKALSIDGRLLYASAPVAFNIGNVYLRNAIRGKARECFEAALKQRPDMEKARRALERL